MFPVIAYSQKQKDPTEEEVKASYSSLPKVDGQYEWTEVVQVDSSLKKDDLYRNAKMFFANEFKSAKDVLQYDDRAEGKVIGKGNFHIEDLQNTFLVIFTDKRDVNFTIEIFCKDGKYKYRIYGINADCIFRGSGGRGPDNVTRDNITLDDAYIKCTKGSTKKMDRRLFMVMIDEVQLTIGDIKKGMTSVKKDDF